MQTSADHDSIMKHDPCADQGDDIAAPAPSDEVTLDDVRSWQALAARTQYAETRRVCLRLVADYFSQHPDEAGGGSTNLDGSLACPEVTNPEPPTHD